MANDKEFISEVVIIGRINHVNVVQLVGFYIEGSKRTLIYEIFDFGLAKLYSTDDSVVTLTAARGTMGYMAPELFYKNIERVSHKADIYSFGMLLMEMAGRRKALNLFADSLSQIYFLS
ncbi:rust resistance kinase Lr10 [Forsythia ovata]|uniref:Rust resistance kinase Lr10 n=1 Tax=Forsythia ovata TaxID=205694 RepID=A0ABD1UTY8_9LAMI